MKRLITFVMIVLTAAVGTSLWAGQSTKPLTEKQAKQLLATANRPEQHEQLAQYFTAKAVRLDREAREHDEWAAIYKTGGARGKGQTLMQIPSHCNDAAAAERKAAQENRTIADIHHKMAEELRTTTPR